MQVTPSNSTVAEYCRQLDKKEIIINRDYQRSDGVWPQQARSYLIETLLMGYPIPKLSLYIKTDIRTRTTVKEIVDGQQRSMTIYAYFNDKFAISSASKSEFAGKKFSQLNEAEQLIFINYQLSIDLFSLATSSDIREVFRRMNSFTIPLNPSEKRYATHQGEFKWFISNITKKFSQNLLDLGVFSEKTLIRMADATFFSEIIMAMVNGISSASDNKINKFYSDNDKAFPDSDLFDSRIEEIFNTILMWEELRGTNLMKAYNFHSLSLAITHHLHPVAALQEEYRNDAPTIFNRDNLIYNLGVLAEALDDPSNAPDHFYDFIKACESGTNRLEQRRTRFVYFCNALDPDTVF